MSAPVIAAPRRRADEMVPWLRRQIESDLTRWRDREAHFLAVREREGDYDYFEAQERVAQLEAELAVLDAHDDAWRLACLYPPGEGVTAWGRAEEWQRAVRLLVAGYKFRDGYKDEWRP